MKIRRMIRAALAAGSIGAVVAIAGGASLALAAPAPITSHDVAGWQTARWTRYLVATTTLPTNATCKAMVAVSPGGFGAGLTLGPAEESNAGIADTPNNDAATIGVSMVPTAAGCGLISPSFASNRPGGPAAQFGAGAVTLSPGDSISMNLFYSQTAHVTKALIVDNTTGDSAATSMPGTATYEHSSVTAGFGPFNSPANRFRLWLFTGIRMTTYTGHNGPLGMFAPAKVNMFGSGGHLEASSPFLWNAGMNFGLYVS